MKNILRLFLFIALVGVISCKSDTKSADGHTQTESTDAVTMANGSYKIDAAATQVLWTGSKPAGQHKGVVPVSGGSLMVTDGKIAGGSFELDLANLSVTDLAMDKGKADLEGHLKGSVEEKADDFFNVGKYPKGQFVITKVTQVQSNPDANMSITGDLTLKDQTHPVSFLAQVDKTESGINATSKEFKIDRTKWGLQFMSKSFFDDLKDKFIDDEIALKIKLSAKKS